MSEAQAQEQAASEAAEAAAEATQSQEAQEAKTLTWEEHTRELQRVGKKEKSEGKTAAERAILERAANYGIDSVDDIFEKLETFSLIENEDDTEAEKLQKRLEKVQPRAEKAERYEKALTSILERERDGLPEHITALLNRMDPADQLDYIAEHRDTLRGQSQEQPQPSIGAGSSPGTMPSTADMSDPVNRGRALLGFLQNPPKAKPGIFGQ